MNLRIVDSINKINIIINEVKIYGFYNNLLSNLRVNLFVAKLKKDGISANEIKKILNL
ncbi:MAG: hypothetical protein LBQ24_01875 [Candidatus Peribacteria bacterium]|nr:hypothetical protein [Candidatus Peribacteria bacterium]